MLLSGPRSLLTLDRRADFVIAPHHRDRLGRPPVRPGAVDHGRMNQAMTWNVFRTLELLPPAFWLRRLHVRLASEAPFLPPQITTVSLWRALPLPPIQRIDGGRADVVVDVVIETEHAVWTLATPADGEAADDSSDALLDAGAWLAGARDHNHGIVESRTTANSFGGVLKARLGRSRNSVALRSATRGPTAPNRMSFGTIEWDDVVGILAECQDAHNLSPIDRALARNAVEWCREVGDERRV